MSLIAKFSWWIFISSIKKNTTSLSLDCPWSSSALPSFTEINYYFYKYIYIYIYISVTTSRLLQIRFEVFYNLNLIDFIFSWHIVIPKKSDIDRPVRRNVSSDSIPLRLSQFLIYLDWTLLIFIVIEQTALLPCKCHSTTPIHSSVLSRPRRHVSILDNWSTSSRSLHRRTFFHLFSNARKNVIYR